jgi:hypothetical protein
MHSAELVEQENGAGQASDDADVSIAPSQIPYGGFSPKDRRNKLPDCGRHPRHGHLYAALSPFDQDHPVNLRRH